MCNSYIKIDSYEGLDSNETKRAIIPEIACLGWEDILPISDSYSESELQDQVSN